MNDYLLTLQPYRSLSDVQLQDNVTRNYLPVELEAQFGYHLPKDVENRLSQTIAAKATTEKGKYNTSTFKQLLTDP